MGDVGGDVEAVLRAAMERGDVETVERVFVEQERAAADQSDQLAPVVCHVNLAALCANDRRLEAAVEWAELAGATIAGHATDDELWTEVAIHQLQIRAQIGFATGEPGDAVPKLLASASAEPGLLTVNALVAVAMSAVEAGHVAAAAAIVDRVDQLDDSRAVLTAIASSAARWQGLTATILGLFGAVAFVAGPKAVTVAASPGVARLSLLLVAMAFLTALVAVVKLAGVAHRAPQLGVGVTAADYRQAHVDAARADLAQLRRAQHLTVVAGVLVATGSLILSFGSITAADDRGRDPVHALVRTDDATLCGAFSVDGDGALLVDGKEVGPANDVQIVAGCGASP